MKPTLLSTLVAASLVFSLFFSLIFSQGCVSSGKHKKLLAEHDHDQKTLAELNINLEEAQTRIRELETLSNELERKLGKASTDKQSLRDSVEQMKTALREASERKKEVEKRISEYKKLVKQFRTLTAAGDLSIKIVDGRMVVALPSDILFKSGSARLSDKGRNTIKKVSELLVGIEDKKFQVEGHTDNVPIKTATYPSNWELASARAVNVLRTMAATGMPEERVSAASFGPTRPVQANESSEGKQANRRIEVVLVPDLSTLPGYDELQKLSE